MIEVVSVKYKNRGKSYYFSPEGLTIRTGQQVVVETAKGMELADCCRGNHEVPEEAVVLPLRRVVRIATRDDLRIAEYNKQREKEAFRICRQKIEQHGLDMKLVDVECNFDGSKTTFFFTSDGRVDFRELVKDLASVFRNRIELRQIGVRDEAKMIGGIGICGKPYCCSQFLDGFQPVSTKMAKVQSLSLNPAKISGSCGRLMCCLRYEQEAYEDLLKTVPKQGAFVETKDGFGTAASINLLRQTVQVRLDGDGDDALRLYKANELCTVPGGRPKDGEQPVSTLVLEPEIEEELPEVEEWPLYTEPQLTQNEQPAASEENKQDGERGNRRRRQKKQGRPAEKPEKPEKPERAQAVEEKTVVKPEVKSHPKQEKDNRGSAKKHREPKNGADAAARENAAPKKPVQKKEPRPEREMRPEKKSAPAVKESAPAQNPEISKPEGEQTPHKKNYYNRRRYYRGKPHRKPEGGNE